MKTFNTIPLILAFICILLPLSGCMSMGTKVDPAQAMQFQKGVTTEADIIAALGQPNNRATMPGGKTAIGYMNLSGRPDAAMFIPYIGPFIGKVESETTLVNFIFDSQGKLAETTTNTSNVRGGLFGGD